MKIISNLRFLYIFDGSRLLCGGGGGGCSRQDGLGQSVEKLGREDFLLGWYNITCLCKATKGLGALRAYVGAKFLGWPIVPSSMGAYYRTGSPLLESLTLT